MEETLPRRSSLGGWVALLALAACGSDVALPEASPPPPPAVDGADASTSLGPGEDIDGGRPPSADAGDAGDAGPPPDCVIDADCTEAPYECGAKGNATGHCLSARSCDGTPGTWSCGPNGNADCCVRSAVPGGSYDRNGVAETPATVSSFKLDTYEITVARMRVFFAAVNGDLRTHPPAVGSGAHPKVPGSGWRASFNVRLPGSTIEIDDRLGPAGCVKGGNNDDGGTATWTSQPGPYEDKPITCIDWYTLFAFCAWDGGRIPTDAELGYAAAGGSENRVYAWGTPAAAITFLAHKDFVVTGLRDYPEEDPPKQTWGPIYRTLDPTGQRYVGGPEMIAPPGRKPLGNGRWGHADLTGNVLEWTLDEGPAPAGHCIDCANVAWPDPPQDQAGVYPPQWRIVREDGSEDTSYDGARTMRGGSWDATHLLMNFGYYVYNTYRTYGSVGGRCARD